MFHKMITFENIGTCVLFGEQLLRGNAGQESRKKAGVRWCLNAVHTKRRKEDLQTRGGVRLLYVSKVKSRIQGI